MKFSWYSPGGVQTDFSSTSNTYRLLKTYSGLATTPITHLTKQAPYQDGSTRIDSHYEPRPVSFDILIQAPNLENLQAAIRHLVLELNPLAGEGSLIYTQEDGTQYLLTCIANSTPHLSTSVRTPTIQLATLDFLAHDPFWRAYPNTITPFGAGTPLTYTYTYPTTYPLSTGQQTIQNDGNAATGVTIVVTGEIVNPVITRKYTDTLGNTTTESLTFTITMSSDDVLTVTTGFGNKTIKYWNGSTYVANPFQYLVTGSVFWQLVPGENVISVTSTAISAGTVTTVETTSKYTGV